jgi:hypothetical protein
MLINRFTGEQVMNGPYCTADFASPAANALAAAAAVRMHLPWT